MAVTAPLTGDVVADTTVRGAVTALAPLCESRLVVCHDDPATGAGWVTILTGELETLFSQEAHAGGWTTVCESSPDGKRFITGTFWGDLTTWSCEGKRSLRLPRQEGR